MSNETDKATWRAMPAKDQAVTIMAGEGHDVDTVAAAYGNTNEEAKARAALIVRAVNSNEKLVEACEQCTEYLALIRQDYPDLPGLIAGLELARDALAEAKP